MYTHINAIARTLNAEAKDFEGFEE